MSEQVERDPGPVARFEAVKANESTPSEVFARLTDPERPQTLDEIAKAWRVPRGAFVEWFMLEHGERYDSALKVLGASLGHRVLELADGATAERLGVLKLQANLYLRLAGHWHSERYSPKVEHKHTGDAPVLTIVCLSAPSGEGGASREKVVGEVREALPAPHGGMEVSEAMLI